MRAPLLGPYQVAICMRSGKKMRRKDMVEDGQVKGLLVAPEWWEPYHPQLLPPPMRPDGLPKQRPAPDDSTQTVAGTLSIAVVSDTEAELTWTAASNTETMIHQYVVWRSTDGAAAVAIDTVPVTQDIYIEDDVDGSWQQSFVYTQPYVDESIVEGHTYAYYVQAIAYYGGQPADTNTVTISTAIAATLSGSLSGQTADLTWTTTGTGITAFNLYRSTGDGAAEPYQALGNVSGYDDADLDIGTTYNYWVQPVASGVPGPLSNEVSLTPAGDPALVTFNITAGQGS